MTEIAALITGITIGFCCCAVIVVWFVPDGSMYVYYEPTHWRELTTEEPARG